MKNIVLPLLILCLLFACNNQEQEAENTVVEEIEMDARLIAKAEPTFEGINLPIVEKKIKTSEAVEIEVASGTRILIPDNAFVDKNGQDVTGEVIVKYKEIKSPSDIIIENVDMTYDSAGVTYQFQTAGMFDLRAFSKGEELSLKPGKKIDVEYVTDKKGDYNLYYYGDNGWDYRGVSTNELPLNAEVDRTSLPMPLKPVKTNPDTDLILDLKLSHKHIPELAIYRKVIWKYDGDLSHTEVGQILSSKVYKTEIVPSGLAGKYHYNFKTTKGEYQFPVVPVFHPVAYKKAMKKYNERFAQTNNVPVKVKRKVSVSNLGLMNYDRIYHRSDAQIVNASFAIKDEPETKVEGLPLFHITGEDDVVVNIKNNRGIYYSKNLKNKIVTVLPDKTVAVLGTKSFLEQLEQSQDKSNVSFELEKIDKAISSPTELDNIISSL